MGYQTVNPANDEVLKTYYHIHDKDIEAKLERAQQSFQIWKNSDFKERQNFLLGLAELLNSREKKLAEVITKEMGKPIVESLAEVKKCADACRYYAEMLPEFLQKKEVKAHYKTSLISFQPLGPIFSIMPWNYPFWQMFRFAAPALAAGNVILLKHSDITSGCAEEIEKLFYEVQSELHLCQNLRINHDQAAKVIADPRVCGVTFTGSTRGGRQVAQAAAASLKKTVLELGGSDAYIICEDADIEKAAKTCVRARLINNGQSCVAGKRFIVHKKVSDKFQEIFVNEMSSYVIGDPMDINTKLGPLAHRRFLKNLQDQMNAFEALKTKRIEAKQELPLQGAYVRPSVFLFDKPNPNFFSEEIFGPVAMLVSFEGMDEALRWANQSPYGLGGGVFTSHPEKVVELFEKEMQVGMLVVNDFVRSDPRMPFGGVKNSGHGRELGAFGIYEFVNVKTIGISG